MQRPSWNELRKSWADQYFFEPLSELINRLHEDRGAQIELIALFSPEADKELTPQNPPIYLLILYNCDIDFLRENLFLREHDPSGIFEFFTYSVDEFKQMLNQGNPIALMAKDTGLIIFEKDNITAALTDN